ncbi:MAG: hypothetical protein EXR72_08160 [Myxococcales bacterium]|nr:hypothetical protein [Myxococcales bacterium]
MTSRRRHSPLLGLIAAFALAACGGKQGTISVSILVPVGDDPFVDATKVRVRVGDPPLAEQTVAVSGGHFAAELKLEPPGGNTALAGAVIVEAFDASGQVFARGRTPIVGIVTTDYALVVWVGRIGRAGVLPGGLTRGRDRLCAVAVPRVGALLAGGVADGAAVTDAEVHDGFYHALVKATPLPSPRAGVVGIGYDRPDQLSGAALLVGGGPQDGAPSSELTLFDPRPGTAGVWSALQTHDTLARSDATIARLRDGSFLLSGGIGGDGKPLASATVIVPPPHVSVTATQGAMATPRAGHTATPVQLPQGDGLLLFGGSAAGPAAEVYLAATRSFAPQDAKTGSRSLHTATALPDGRLLIVGGSDGKTPALASGMVFDPGLAPTALAALLPAPRAGHIAFLAGGELLLCGGYGADRKTLPSCDVLDPATLEVRRAIPLAVGRLGGTAIPLESGDILLAGGVGEGGVPVTTLELYTP